jgi:hypothetical protein
MKRYGFILLLVMMPGLVLSANRYVRAGASGNNTGTDWANAYTSLPPTLVRGDTYYIADGSYAGYAFDDQVSGTSLITIIKATPSNHGTEVGWSSSYGDGQAAWGPISFNSSYWVFDGQKGFGTGSQEPYGFRISYRGSGLYVKLVGFNNAPSYITMRHVDMEHAGASGDYGHDIIYSLAGHHYTFSYCYMHDVGRMPIRIDNTDDCIFEYCYIARNENNPVEHSEAIFAVGSDRYIIRYCTFEDIEGTGCIMFSGDSWEIYGNVIFFSPGYTGDKFGNGAIATWTHPQHFSTNVKIYNNVFANLGNALNGGLGLKPGNNVAYNNLWYKCDRPRLNGASHDYNSFFSCLENSASGEAHAQIANGNPFVDLANKNFRLVAGTAPGLKLNQPYDKDADGKTRGLDGTWDRGAFEFNGSPGGNQAPIPNAGPDRYVEVGTEITLDGSASSDPNGDPLTYLWSQISGSPVQFSSTTQSVLRFTPSVAGTYVFRLTVSDGQVSATDEVIVVVRDKSVRNPDSSLIAYWKVDESSDMIARDFAGSHDGTLINGPVWRPGGGKVGGALEFDGVNDYVDIGTIDVGGGTGLSIALWLKADDFSASYARFIAKVTETQDHYWSLSTSDDGTALRFNLKASGTTTVLKTGTGLIQVGIWYHVAATYDGSQMRIYKNGLEVASINKTGAVDTNPNVLAVIGNQPPTAGSWPFDGLIDEVRIYNRALSATEIAAIANPVTTGLSGNSSQEFPTTYELNQNTPNPFNPSTVISFSLPKAGFVALTVYTLLGHQIANLVNAKLPAGRHSVQWFPEGLPTGAYYYRIASNGFVQTKRMLLVK